MDYQWDLEKAYATAIAVPTSRSTTWWLIAQAMPQSMLTSCRRNIS